MRSQRCPWYAASVQLELEVVPVIVELECGDSERALPVLLNSKTLPVTHCTTTNILLATSSCSGDGDHWHVR